MHSVLFSEVMEDKTVAKYFPMPQSYDKAYYKKKYCTSLS